MTGGRTSARNLFPLLLVATVVFLMPGPGLASLAIPDNEPDASAFISDSVHTSKRALDDSGQKIAVIAQANTFIHPGNAEFAELTAHAPLAPDLQLAQSQKIRGPPIEPVRILVA